MITVMHDMMLESRDWNRNDRPDRVEPRAVKRRPKKQIYLTEPRSIVKARLLTGT